MKTKFCLLAIMLFGLSSCADEVNQKPFSEVKVAFLNANYEITDGSVGEITSLIGFKYPEIITVVFFNTTYAATKARSYYNDLAEGSDYDINQDGQNIYFGTAEAMSIYDNIGKSEALSIYENEILSPEL